MAGTASEVGPASQQWRIPPRVQEIISGVIVALLVAGILGIFGLWSAVSGIGGDLRHMRETQQLVHGGITRDIAVLEQWKETFGAKRRFGEEDGDELKRQLRRLELKVGAMFTMRVAHDKDATKYIEKIDQLEKRLEAEITNQSLTESMVNQHLQREKHRGTP